MMIRQDYKVSNENRIALYCQFLENNGKDYEYISFILDYEKIVDYYFEENDTFYDTYSVYFNNLELGKNYNVKVVAKLRDDYLFEVGNLWCYCIETETNEIVNGTVLERAISNISPPLNIPTPIIEVVQHG